MYVELKNIHKSYGNFKASDDVSIEIEKGKLIGLLGPSGSGKTTILRMLAGLEHSDAGDIFIDGVRVNDVPASKRGIGFVFQNYALFRYMSVFDNIAFGLEVQKKNKKEIKERVLELIKLIGLEGMEHRYPHQLSGGQKQRVAFARALAPNPQLLLLDEPFAAIDAKVRQELRSWLKDMIHQVGVTSIFVTHDQDEAIEVADEIIITNHGRVEQKGSPLEIYQKPSTLFVAQFIGQSTIIEEYSKFKGFEKKEYAEQAVIRPEFIRITKKGELQQYISSSEEGTVEKISFRGSHLEIKVRVKGIILTAIRSLEEDAIVVGETISVLIYRLYAFDESNTYLLENSTIEDKNPVFI
ncbi:MAG: transporter [Herbinix sp.]|nr:transporter [Herbinix sp.]